MKRAIAVLGIMFVLVFAPVAVFADGCPANPTAPYGCYYNPKTCVCDMSGNNCHWVWINCL